MRIGVAMGSNLGDRGQWLARARDAVLAAAGSQSDFRQAPIYATAPVDCPPGSPDFLNTALELDIPDGRLTDFHRACQAIEAEFGRPLPKDRHRNAPRPIDIDLLYLESGTFATPDLILPHPRMANRRFVLVPLARIAPDRIPGGHRHTINELLALLPENGEPEPRVFLEEW
ncbi:MAG: 2-amino-4-hydroxy-6-hydroxymethyldihydropteridine diphosphokinase [Verrucomicrobiales bacterium]